MRSVRSLRATLTTTALSAVIVAPALPALAGLTAGSSHAGEPLPGPDANSILVSEIANGGGGSDSNANRVGDDDFIEIGNFGAEPVDISGYRILRCGQTGDAYGPQKVVPDGTTLGPGEKYTVGSLSSKNKDSVPRDADYDETGSTLHSFGFGAWIETPEYDVVDRVGFYDDSVYSDCGQDDRALERPLDHRLNESHQRVANTGEPATDWVVGTRTPDADNVTAARENLEPAPVKISEVAPGAAGTGNASNQFVELTNYGTDPVDVTGWKLFRCGENSTSYIQNPSLPDGVIEPGGTYVIAHAGATPEMLDGRTPDATYSTGMHWRDFGAMLVRPNDKIADRVSFYDNRNSICSEGDSVTQEYDALQNESYHRTGDTGDNASDFMVAQERTPGVTSTQDDLTPPADFARGDLAFSEIVGAGPAGGDDEFVELANYGDEPINLKGYSLVRCEGTGAGNAGDQVADLGDTTLAPGDVYVAAAAGAPAELREKADATYSTGFNQTDGYGAYLRDPEGRKVDAIGVYETVPHSPCVIGSELRNYTKFDLGESYQRARDTGDNEEDFMLTPERTPGELADVKWVDPTNPLEGELDPVELDTATVPGTPKTKGKKAGDDYTATVTTPDADGEQQDVTLQQATPLDITEAKIWAGATRRKVPAQLSIAGERKVATAESLETKARDDAYPFQRYAVPVAEVPEDGLAFTWTGTTRDRNEIQMYAWNGTEWQLLTAAAPSADGDLTLAGTLSAEQVVDGVANVLVIDGPRVEGGLVDEIGVTDQAFADPSKYDWAFNHLTDTQFLSEGFRDVYRQDVSWVVANHAARKIGYATNTGDIIENWIGGNADPVRARKEFGAAKKIQQMLNDADVPNGVLPGNHDNFWGRNNDLYNEFFGPEMYEDESWWGGSYGPDDNSAHYDFVTENGVDFLVLNLPYRPSQDQIDWAREIAASYPSHNVILLTHSYIDTEKNIENRGNRYTARGEDIWSDLVAPSDNIFLVLGGHYHGVATKYGDPVTGEQSDAIEIAGDTVAVRNVGETGRVVVGMLADYQGYRSGFPEPRADTLDRDTGFQRLLQFDVDSELMGVNAYSPHLNSFEAYKYDEPGHRGTADNDWQDGRYTAVDDEFVAKVDLLVEKTVATSSWGLHRLGSTDKASVAAGSPATFTFPAAEAPLWWASVADESGNTVTSAPVGLDAPEFPDAAASTTKLSVEGGPQRFGTSSVALLASVTHEGAGTAAGTVTFRDGDRVLGRAPVRNGVARLSLPAKTAVGAHSITASFAAEEPAVTAPSESATRPARVVKAVATSRMQLGRSVAPRGVRVQATLTVTAAGLTPNGKARLVIRGGGKVRNVAAQVRKGRATVKLPKLPKGAYRVTGRYLGNANVAAKASPAVPLRVR